MTLVELRRALIEIPDVDLPAVVAGLEESLEYLGSDAALASLAEDPYWPKWDSPWWQMLLLFELGEAQRIPKRTARAMVAALDALPLHVFPTRPEDVAEGLDPARHSLCHCAIGCIDQVLAACGVDIQAELPWIRSWFGRYQMSDGGFNCDNDAYLVTDECPSSMVGTVALFEAALRGGPSELTDRAASFLIERELVRGSGTRHNSAERDAAKTWGSLAFPRFYFYDVLRGTTALVRWATAFRRAIPLHVIGPVATQLANLSPDGVVHVGRRAHAGRGTLALGANGVWTRVHAAGSFPLLDAVSQVGAPSPALTAEWRATRRAIIELIDAGLVTE